MFVTFDCFVCVYVCVHVCVCVCAHTRSYIMHASATILCVSKWACVCCVHVRTCVYMHMYVCALLEHIKKNLLVMIAVDLSFLN